MSDSSTVVLYVLFAQKFPGDAEQIRAALKKLTASAGWLPFGGKTVEVTPVAQSEAGGVIEIKFDDHELRLVTINAPLPSTELEPPLQAAHLRPEHKEYLRQHQAHGIIYYDGRATKTVEKFIALYFTAYACVLQGLTGVVNPHTWMCLIPGMLAETIKPDFVKSFRASPAASIALWLGFVKFFRPDNKVWFATRGASLFNLPDFAYLDDLSRAEDAVDMFGTLITYVYDSGAKLAAGHTIQLPGDIYLRFGRVTEYAEFLGQDTLVLERISPSQINRG